MTSEPHFRDSNDVFNFLLSDVLFIQHIRNLFPVEMYCNHQIIEKSYQKSGKSTYPHQCVLPYGQSLCTIKYSNRVFVTCILACGIFNYV